MKQIIEIEQGKEAEYLLISDLHLDNPKCDRKLLKRHLDQAKAKGAKILINGDFFCAMQGNKDRRASKADIMTRHLGYNYFDLIVEDAIEFFAPYKENLAMIGYGNHETSIIKHNETDILARFVHTYNERYKASVQLGGYGGWIKIRCADRGSSYKVFAIKYFHGSGGGGPVTKSLIQDNRIKVRTEGADLIWKGHIHDYVATPTRCEVFDSNKMRVNLKSVWHLSTPTYKEEFNEGTKGWHVETGKGPKPLGGAWLKLVLERRQENGTDILYAHPIITPTDWM
jgi:hypothetical protein